MISRSACSVCLCLIVALQSGCARFRAAPVANPFFVPTQQQELVWERAVDVLHEYQFAVARENQLDGVIETEYKIGSSVLEPWHKDSVGTENRLESTLQSIRRRVLLTVIPVDGGYLVGVEAYKEIEDLPGLAANSSGGATFGHSRPLNRDLDLVVGQSAPSGWIPRGRDPALEQAMLNSLRDQLSR